MMRNSDKTCPCIGCQKRETGANRTSCHGGCEEYKTWREATSGKRLQERDRGSLAEEFLAEARYKGYRRYKYKK